MPAAPPVRLTLSRRVRKHCVRRRWTLRVWAGVRRELCCRGAIPGSGARSSESRSGGVAGGGGQAAGPHACRACGNGVKDGQDRRNAVPGLQNTVRNTCGLCRVRVWPALWSDGSAVAWQMAGLLLTPDPLCRKKLIDSEEEYSKLTGKKPSLRQWLALKNRQYNVTSALYMLDWWALLNFLSVFTLSLCTEVVLGPCTDSPGVYLHFHTDECGRQVGAAYFQLVYDERICGHRHRHVHLLPQFGLPLCTKRLSVWLPARHASSLSAPPILMQ